MQIFAMLIIIFSICRISCNPYCALKCKYEKENGICTLFRKAIKVKLPEDGEIWEMTNDVRHDVILYVNNLRDTFARGKLGNWTSISNMQYVNYDLELEYLSSILARLDQSYAFNRECLNSVYLQLNYIVVSHLVKADNNLVTGTLFDTFRKIIDSWAYFSASEGVFENENQRLLYHPRVDYMGCSIFVWTKEYDDPAQVQLNTVCVFGAVDVPLIPYNSSDKNIKKGIPCKRCRSDLYCNSRLKGLCGSHESFGIGCNKRWHTKYWYSPDFQFSRGHRSSYNYCLHLIVSIYFIRYFST